MQTEVRQKIRALIGKFGLKAVHEAIDAESREIFAYLQPLYTQVAAPVHNVVITRDVIPDVAQHTQIPDTGDIEDDVPVEQEEGVKTVVVTAGAAGVKISKEENKAKREKHDADVAAKRKEYQDKGVDPVSLLTKENLSNWLKQGLTYWQIAEATGCKDSEVSGKAKAFGLQSQMSKYIIAKRSAKSKE